ncbi:MAG: prepilin-type N-terminal cleavage/methylation domain-containing protein [Gammaproteobacteria bacterium]|nr:prepilin-type N-terminal cleavage/methylation domain-containing protein [Gammaproteobacteria bacterium]
MKNFQYGFTFIEVLVALCLMSIVLLGIEKMLIMALRMNRQAWFQTISVNQIKNMAEIIKIKREGWTQFYPMWQMQNQLLLPKGMGKVLPLGPKFNIFVLWHSSEFSVWRCETKAILNQSCLELKS